jgi:hypothetical protein
MKKLFILITVLFFTTIVLSQAPQKKMLALGDSYQGGKVGYLLKAGDPGFNAKVQHGIIVVPGDISDGTEWGCVEKIIPGADETNIGRGSQNTKDIVAGCNQAGIAARRCSDLELNGYSDWYLPSKDELSKLYINRVKTGSFTDAFYWSSCESDATYAWGQDFYDGTQGRVSKDSAGHVIAVRTF